MKALLISIGVFYLFCFLCLFCEGCSYSEMEEPFYIVRAEKSAYNDKYKYTVKGTFTLNKSFPSTFNMCTVITDKKFNVGDSLIFVVTNK